MRCRYRRGAAYAVEADLGYVVREDGTCRVTSGSLPGNGLAEGRGITVPEEIGGACVMGLDELWTEWGLDYVDGPALRDVAVDVFVTRGHLEAWRRFARFGDVFGRHVASLRITCNVPLAVRLSSASLRSVMIAAPSISLDGHPTCPALEEALLLGRAFGGSSREMLLEGCPSLRELEWRE